MWTQQTTERTLAFSMRTETRGYIIITLLDLNWDSVRWAPLCLSTPLCMSSNEYKSTMNMALEVTSKFQQAGEFANMKTETNEKQPYYQILYHVEYIQKALTIKMNNN